MLKPKTSAVLSLALVFVSGGLVGVLAHRAYIVRGASANTQTKLKLDNAQTAALNGIFDQTEVEVRDLRAKEDSQRQALQNALVEKIDNILRPDQHELYKQYREERERERQRRKMQGPAGGPLSK